ncbi:MAG: hypothetical protein MUP76_04195, partial [Acidimicrobiia bacterium]|nr:hypothetical protein [Acidimicrobiia bacterium]
MGMRRALATAATTLLLLAATPLASAQGEPTVHGLLFYSPTCGNCHEVIDNQLPGIFEAHGGAPVTAFRVGAA